MLSRAHRAATLAAVVLSIAVAGSAAAATGSASTSQTLTVVGAASISLAGVPTSVSFGSVTTNGAAGHTTAGSAANGFTPISDTMQVQAVNIASWSLTITQADMTGSGSPIPAVGNAAFLIDTIGGGGDPTFGGLGTSPYGGPIVGAITSVTSPTGDFGLAAQWSIPAAANGSYGSTLTLTASGS